jgi:hypothetical protein
LEISGFYRQPGPQRPYRLLLIGIFYVSTREVLTGKRRENEEVNTCGNRDHYATER